MRFAGDKLLIFAKVVGEVVFLEENLVVLEKVGEGYIRRIS